MAWLERHAAHAPPVLRDRVKEFLAAAPAGALPGRLSAAGAAALASAEARLEDRAAALDLLAADALVTLALLAEAQREPAGLHAFAGAMLRRAGGA